jgi:hypothetical protein
MERHRYLKMTFESSVESVVKTSRAVKLTTDYMRRLRRNL